MSESKQKITNPNNIKPRKVEPGPENVHFQEYSNDEALGKNPMIHKPMKFSQGIGEYKTIYEAIKDDLQAAYQCLEEFANVNKKNNTTNIGPDITDAGSEED